MRSWIYGIAAGYWYVWLCLAVVGCKVVGVFFRRRQRRRREIRNFGKPPYS